MKPLKESISITLDDNILAALKVMAEEHDRSVSSTINLIVKQYLKNPTKLPD